MIVQMADHAGGMINQYLDQAEDSPMLENILSSIENNIPTDEQVNVYP